MKRLGLFRHAKSDWNDARLTDFDRPLNERGRKGAELMGRYVRDCEGEWQRVVASPAVRVTQTIEIAAFAAGSVPPVIWDRRVYLATSDSLIELVREFRASVDNVIIAGHNPGLEDLIFDLVPDDGSSPLRDEVELKFPTAAFAVLEIDIDDWSEVAPGCARFVSLKRPRDLDDALGPQPVSARR